MKHTKGPWIVHSNGIAVFNQDKSTCLSIAPTDADARLIAAAPELLEQLKYARSALRILKPAHNIKEYRVAEFLALLAGINETIAKAEGGES